MREAVQMASGSFSNSTARMVAPIGPMPKKVTPMPCGKQTVCWYFHPVAKMTNSVMVAMTSNGSAKYEMRLLFNRCHGENPLSCGAAEGGELCEFVELEFFINERCKTGHYSLRCALKRRTRSFKRRVSDPDDTNRRFNLALPLIMPRPRHLACQCADTTQNLPCELDLP